jgi:hypothetical protein
MSARRSVGATPRHGCSAPRACMTLSTPSPKFASPKAARVTSRERTAIGREARPPEARRST